MGLGLGSKTLKEHNREWRSFFTTLHLFQKQEPYYDHRLNAIVVPSVYGLFPYYGDLGSFVPGVFDAASMGLGIAKALAHAFDLDLGTFNEWGERVPDGEAWQSDLVEKMRVSCSVGCFRLQKLYSVLFVDPYSLEAIF